MQVGYQLIGRWVRTLGEEFYEPEARENPKRAWKGYAQRVYANGDVDIYYVEDCKLDRKPVPFVIDRLLSFFEMDLEELKTTCRYKAGRAAVEAELGARRGPTQGGGVPGVRFTSNYTAFCILR